ncbi:MAG: thiamine diphosphokinase, partial [Deltaproteobacteria bacterium]|nr:thiamine diphosphokinase [Deltaproteobacteria bacterium]
MNSPDLVYIFLNGDFNPPVDLPPYPNQSTLIVAVDGGATNCLKLGWPIHVLIGDLDSLPKATFKRAQKNNPEMEVAIFAVEKDETDFELALQYVLNKYANFGRIEVLGALGGRVDMTLSNLLLPYSERYLTPIRQSRLQKGQTLAPPIVTFRDGYWTVLLLSGPGWAVLPPFPVSRRISLIPMSPKASKVRLTGDFKYPLNDEDLFLGLTKGVSNELGPKGGTVFLGAGLMILTISPLLKPGLGFKKTPEPVLAWKNPSDKPPEIPVKK